MTRAESLGSSLSDALSELATEVRDARRSAANERARKAPVKMLFPLVFLRSYFMAHQGLRKDAP